MVRCVILRQTNKMKKVLALPFILFFSVAAMAQEKYVEVVVSDTMLVEPQEWIMHLNIESKYEPVEMIDSIIIDSGYDSAVYTQPGRYLGPRVMKNEGTSPEQLSALVKKFGGRILSDANGVNYNLVVNHGYSGNQSKGYVNASFTNRKSLENFLEEAKKLGDVESQVIGTQHPKIQDFQAGLEKKIMTAAKAKAARLADLGGRKMGGVILISEVTETEGGSLKSFLEAMIKLEFDRKYYALYMDADKIRLEKSLKVRFAIL